MLANVAASSGRARWARLPLAALVALSLAGPAPQALAVSLTFFVTITTDTADGNCDFDCSLREAIDAANANPGADRIEVPQGTYVLTISGAGEDLNASGDLDLREDVTIVGSGAAKVTITLGGDTDDRVLQIMPGVTAAISGVTLAGGKAGTAPGGGIYSQGVLTLADSVVRNSSASSGGGISASGLLTLTNVTVKDNVVAGAGGGVASQAQLIVGGSIFSGNQAGGSGGGISASAPVGITGSIFSGNQAGGSGGGISSGAALTLGNTTVSENQAASSGGGIQSAGQLSITASTIAANSAGAIGGGVSNAGSATLTNVTISGNSAASGGGLANSGSATLASLTVASNSASGGGGGLLNNPGKSLALKNSIVADNSGSDSPDCAGVISSQGHNLLGVVGQVCALSAATGDLLGGDPQLGELRDNGGPTPTRALLAGSPALDAGSPAQPGAAGACPSTDQRGVSRPQTGRCDIGAFELAGVAIVDFAFQPANLVVKAGTTVRWKNLGATSHTTKSDNPVGAEPWNSPLIEPGEVFMRTFNTAGSYSYFCTIHQSMTGTITVIGPSVNPAPLLTSIDPSSAPAGSPALVLTLTGLNFDVDATVDWGGVSLEVLSRSDQQFQAKVPAALLASAGVVRVRVVNPQAAGGPTNALTFRIIAGAPDHQLFIPLARNGA